MTDDERAEAAAVAAIGLRIRLHVGERTYVTGRISECRFVDWQRRGTSRKHAVFSITVLSGKNEAYPYTYTVLELPNPESDELGIVRVLEYAEPNWSELCLD